MSPSDRFWLRVQRRASSYTPDVAAAMLRALALLRARFGARAIEEAIARGDVGAVLERALSDVALDAAFQPVREQLLEVTREAVPYFARDIPIPPPLRHIGIAFNVLNPRVLDAVRTLDSRVFNRLAEDLRGTVRQVIERGLVEGVGPRTTARALRDVMGLAPNQEAAIHNFQRMLEAGDLEALTRQLRDRRYDGVIRRAFAEGGPGLSAGQVERMTSAYRRRMVAYNAETQARTATLDALKSGQQLAYEDAIAKGVIEQGQLRKTWKGVMDDRERPEHVAMEGETVPMDEPYSNGEMIPGESTFNCRCLSLIAAVA